MRLGHVIYVVKDLDAAVKEWRDKGFTVEYGRSLRTMCTKTGSKVVYRTGKKNADALKHLVQDEILEVIEGNDTKIEAVEYAKT